MIHGIAVMSVISRSMEDVTDLIVRLVTTSASVRSAIGRIQSIHIDSRRPRCLWMRDHQLTQMTWLL